MAPAWRVALQGVGPVVDTGIVTSSPPSSSCPAEQRRIRTDLLALLERTTGAFIAGDSAEIHDRIHETLEGIGSMFDVDRAYLFAFSSGLSAMTNTHEWCAEGIGSEIANLQEVPTDIAPWWMAELGAGRHINLGSLDELPDHAEGERAILEPQGVQSLLVVPMSWGDRLEGFAGFDHVRSARRWDDEEIGVLRVIVNCFAQAIERGRREARIEELRALAFQDPLTGLANRSLLMDRLGQAMARTRRSGRLAALCYLDLDGFKPINDSFGHQAGDVVLVDVAERLRACVRGVDTVARVGGDEFVVLLTDLAAPSALRPLVERFSAAIAAPYDVGSGVTAFVQASIGVRLVTPGDGEADTLLRQADKAMYAAKHAGGGSIRVFDPDVHGVVEDWSALVG